jgi:tetratricopeptide (TPR) repeat protein
MASHEPKCADAACEGFAAGFRITALGKRSQRDFEIDFFEGILNRDPCYVEVLIHLGDLFASKGCFKRALKVDLRLARLRPANPTVFYNLACSHAVLGQTSEALTALDRAVDLGYHDLDYLRCDPDLSAVRNHPGFPAVLAKLEALCGDTRIV